MVRLYVCASLRIMEGVVIVYLVKLVEEVIVVCRLLDLPGGTDFTHATQDQDHGQPM